MLEKQINTLEIEINDLESNLLSIKELSSKNSYSLNQENGKLNQLKEQRIDLVGRRNKLGFFERFGLFEGEGKRIKKEISNIDKKTLEHNTNIEKLNGEAYALSTQENEAQNKVNNLRNELTELKKEEQWKQDIQTGKISYNTELDRIEEKLNEYESNLFEFRVKYELWMTWHKMACEIGTDSYQANELWSQARSKYHSSPMEAVRWHDLNEKMIPKTELEKIGIINRIYDDARSFSLLEKSIKLKEIEGLCRKIKSLPGFH
jgi:DNA repair exonuclease SbcCD ATPase subunit